MDNGYMSSTTTPLLFLNNSPSLPDLYSSSLPHSNSSGLKVESLELPELLKNPLVQQMYDHAQQAASQVMKDNEEIKSLWKENRNLSTELQSVRNELQTLKTSPIL
jgi:septal ring factor EnvC (AmiA/AmiB activator)